MRGSGMPLMIPSVELIEIGAGGGSIARLIALGLLKVGPDSAGAEPGARSVMDRRHRADGHRRESAPWLSRSRLLPRRPARLDSTRRGGAGQLGA